MLAPALKVVDAAKALNPIQIVAGKPLWKLGIPAMTMSEKFRDLGEAIAEFDRHAGNKNDAREMLGRAIRYASERGIPAQEMISAISVGSADIEEEVRAIDATMQLRPKPGDLGRPDPVQDGSPVIVYDHDFGADVEIAPQYQPPAPVLENKEAHPELRMQSPVPDLTPLPTFRARRAALAAKMGYEHDHTPDAENYTNNAEVELDAISDRLEYAVRFQGWTPKLKKIAGAWIHARTKISMDLEAGRNIALQDLALVARCAADLARLEVDLDYAHENDKDATWHPPVLRPQGF